jgi:integrase/recombinase XerD
MSNTNSNNPPNVKPFGNSEYPRGFYQLLLAHVTWLAVHNFSKTTVEKRALYVKSFALWCSDCDLASPHVITKPILEAYQRHLFSYRKSDGKPLAWSSQHLHLKEVKQFFSWLAKQNYIPFSPATETSID